MNDQARLITLPLVYQSADSILKPKVGIEDTYKSIRNRLRKYSATSIVDLALAMLWTKYKDSVDELQAFPWLALLIVKWALQDSSVNLRVGRPIPVQDMDLMRQQLWELPGSGDELGQDRNVFLMLRSLLHVQTEFQRRSTWSFLRWPALYARLPEGKARIQFRTAFGMEPDTFIDLAFALYAMVLSGNLPMQPDPLAVCRPHYGNAVDKIYEIFVRDLVGLRTELQRDSAQRIRGRHELYEFPYLKRFPLVRLRNGRIHCWHLLVFARGVEDIVHLRLSEQFGEEYTRSFSRVFEDYVTELAVSTGKPCLTEAAYKEILNDSAPAVEAIFEADDCNILVEAKMSFFADDVLLQDSERRTFEKTKKVRDGIAQGWKVGKLLRKHPSLHPRFSKKEDYLLVVTSRDLLVGGGEMLTRLYEPNALTYPDADAERNLPLRNVFVVGIEDYEITMNCVRAGLIDLQAILRKASDANQRGDTSRLFFADFLREHLKACPQPIVLHQARVAAETRLNKVFVKD